MLAIYAAVRSLADSAMGEWVEVLRDPDTTWRGLVTFMGGEYATNPAVLGYADNIVEFKAVTAPTPGRDGDGVYGTYRFHLHPAYGMVPRMEEVEVEDSYTVTWPTYEELGHTIDQDHWETAALLPNGAFTPVMYVPPTPEEGYLNGDADTPAEQRKVRYVEGQFMQKYPVTVVEWNYYAAAVGQDLKPLTAERRGETISVADHPVTSVDWFQCGAFAKWAGLCLIDEWDWEWAARGPDGRIYPWGNETPTTELCVSSIDPNNTPGGTLSVYTCPKGASPYGLMQMVGNAWEWMANVYRV